jgi:hypothetical protein
VWPEDVLARRLAQAHQTRPRLTVQNLGTATVPSLNRMASGFRKRKN